MGPTSANAQPLRIVWVKSDEAKVRLANLALATNASKIRSAPVTAILAYDLKFYDHLPRFFPHADAKSWFVSSEELAQATAFRNSSLQGGYFIMAARALGLDTGPMSGFDNAKVDVEFFSGTAVKSNFLINIGHGDPAKLFPRSPRLSFEEIAHRLRTLGRGSHGRPILIRKPTRDGQSTTMPLPSLIAFTERSVFGGDSDENPDRPHDLRTVMV